MPLYSYICAEGHPFDRLLPLADYKAPQKCPCGAEAEKTITAPRFFIVDNVGYNCPVTGEWISSKRQHEENLRKQDCRVLESGEKEANLRSNADFEAALESRIESTVEREIETMPSEKRENLYNELTRGGVDLAYTRATPNL